jgi:hypothetical protein
LSLKVHLADFSDYFGLPIVHIDFESPSNILYVYIATAVGCTFLICFGAAVLAYWSRREIRVWLQKKRMLPASESMHSLRSSSTSLNDREREKQRRKLKQVISENTIAMQNYDAFYMTDSVEANSTDNLASMSGGAPQSSLDILNMTTLNRNMPTASTGIVSSTPRSNVLRGQTLMDQFSEIDGIVSNVQATLFASPARTSPSLQNDETDFGPTMTSGDQAAIGMTIHTATAGGSTLFNATNQCK